MLPINPRPHSTSSIDFSSLKLESQKLLFDLLDEFDGSKTIIWDDSLIGPFEFVANANSLKQHNAIRLFRLSDLKPAVFNEIHTDFCLFFLRKEFSVARRVGSLLRRSQRAALAKTCLVFVPFRCASIEKVLQLDKIDLNQLHSIRELNIELYVLDSDIISTENEFVYRDLYLNHDRSFAHQIAEGLIKLQDIYGQIPRISGQGMAAKLVYDLLVKNRRASSQSKSISTPPQIHHLVLIDRKIDLVTPLITQQTYEGLLDEVFQVNHGTVTLPGEKFVPPKQPDEEKKTAENEKSEKPVEMKRFELRSSEELFAKLRDCHVNAVADVLKQSAKNLQAEYEECNSTGKTIPEIGKIVKRLNHLKVAKKSQANHVAIAELVNEQILKAEFIMGLRIEHELLQDDRINRIVPEIDMKLLRQESSLHLLRLICLQSIVCNGFKSKIADYYKKEIVQNYGSAYIAFLLQLERADLLLRHERYYDNGTFNQLKNRFNLTREDVNECDPNHMSYVYGGYAPLSVVVAKILAQSSQSPLWRSQSDNLKLLPGPTISHSDSMAKSGSISLFSPNASGNQANVSGLLSPSESSNSLTSNALAAASMLLSGASGPVGLRTRRNSATSSHSSSEETRVVLVFFIGGCTFAEISALRFLSQQEENNCEFLFGTTKIINGRTFLNSLWPLSEKIKSNFQG